MVDPTPSSDQVDPFYTQRAFPEPQDLFSFSPVDLQAAKKDSTVIIDTNALLVPYGIGTESLAQIESTYRSLVKEHRLLIPGQVAREFAKHRSNKLAELYKQLSDKRRISIVCPGTYPLLQSTAEYQRVLELEKQLASLIEAYGKSIGELLYHIKGWNWDDPVSSLYRILFTEGVVSDPPLDHTELLADLEWRIANKVPPAYKDAAKPDRGIGDLIIWHTILAAASKTPRNALFVTGDEKADWWVRSETQPLYPRFELVDEYRRSSHGMTFQAIRFSQFLELFGAPDTVVAEVQREEAVTVPDWLLAASETSPRLVTIHIRSTGDKQRDSRRMHRLQGLLTSYPGRDRFEFRVHEANRRYSLEFPHTTTSWSDELHAQIAGLVGHSAVEVKDLPAESHGDEAPDWLLDQLRSGPTTSGS